MLKTDYIRLIHMFFSSKKSILYQIFGLCIKGKINHKDTENTKRNIRVILEELIVSALYET